jgi:hypothetical protein
MSQADPINGFVDNIKMDLGEIRVEWTELIWLRKALVNMVMNL